MNEFKGKAVVFEEGYPVTCERCGHEFYADIATLEMNVIEAAKAWRTSFWPKEAELVNAIDALNEFEAAQNLGKQE